jgi:hypothetical protein
MCDQTRHLMRLLSRLQDTTNAEDKITSAEDALSLICEEWTSMLGNLSRVFVKTAESTMFLRYETMIQALLSINPYLAPNFVPPGDIPWPILCPRQHYPPKLAEPSTYSKDEITNFIIAYGRWSGQSFDMTVQSTLNTWTVISTRFRSGDLNIQVVTIEGLQGLYAMKLMKKVLKVLRELQRGNYVDTQCK